MDNRPEILNLHYPPSQTGALQIVAGGASRVKMASRSGRGALAAVSRRRGTVWFDYTDLVNYLQENRVLTDCYRSQIGIFRASLAYNCEVGEDRIRIGICSFDQHRCGWVALSETLLAWVCHAACQAGDGAAADDAETWGALALTGKLRRSVTSSVSAPLALGDALLDVGHSWSLPYYLSCADRLKRDLDITITWMMSREFLQQELDTCGADPAPAFRREVSILMDIMEFGVMADKAAKRRPYLQPLGR